MVSPIKDTNANFTLDEQDLLKQLKAENSKGSLHQEVHGMLKVAGIQKVVNELYADLLKNHVQLISGSITGHESDIGEDAIKEKGAKEIVELLKSTAKISEEPELLKALEDTKYNARHSLALNNIQRKVLLDDLDNIEEFSRSFKETFPKGVKISPEDVPAIMQQFPPQIRIITANKKEIGKTSI